MNSAEQKELRVKVHSYLVPFYESNSFMLNKANGVFNKHGFEVFWGVSAKYIDCIYFNPSISVSNEGIRNILGSILTGESYDITIYHIAGCRLAQEFGVHEYDYLVDSEDNIDNGTTYKVDQNTDLEAIVADHMNYMEKVGFPFF